MANHRTSPLSRNGFTPLDCQCFQTNKSFKHRNPFYKNEAITRFIPIIQCNAKQRIEFLPYNAQDMLDTNKTKVIDITTSVYMFQKQFQIISINHRRHKWPIPLCRHTRLYNQKPQGHVLEVGFPSMNRGKGSSSPPSR